MRRPRRGIERSRTALERRFASRDDLTGDFAAAISIAAERVLGPRASAKACLARLESRFVHVARDGRLITVDFSPNDRCGTGIGGGGAHVVLDAKTLKVEHVTLQK